MKLNSTASATTETKNYFDNHLSFSFDFDKRNQKFQTTEVLEIIMLWFMVISETNTLNNTLIFQIIMNI